MASLIRVSADCALSVKDEMSIIHEITIPKIVAPLIKSDTSRDFDGSAPVSLVGLMLHPDL